MQKKITPRTKAIAVDTNAWGRKSTERPTEMAKIET
jgi:hypothetical protein